MVSVWPNYRVLCSFIKVVHFGSIIEHFDQVGCLNSVSKVVKLTFNCRRFAFASPKMAYVIAWGCEIGHIFVNTGPILTFLVSI